MPDLDDDALRAALRDLYESALPHANPPGLDAVHRRLRRRTTAQVTALAMVACAALVTIVLTLPTVLRGPLPADDLTPSPTGPTPTVTSSASPTASPSPTAGPSPSVSPEPAQATTCDSNPRVGVSYSEPVVRFWLYSTTGDPICAGVEKTFTWASYRYLDDGRQLRHGGATWPVRPGQTYSDEISIHPGCPGDIYFAAGSFSVAALEPGMHHPFPIASAENNWQGTLLSYVVPSSPCVTAPTPLASVTTPPF